MATYTLFRQQATGSSLVTDTAGYTMGVQFTVSLAGCTLAAVWFYSAPGAPVLPQQIALFQVTGGSLVTAQNATWSGAAGSGWVRAAFTVPPSLTASAAYKACVKDDSGNSFYSATTHYWDTGAGSSGITNGPLSAPNNAGGDHGQDTFHTPSATASYPDTSFGAANYWVDPEISAPASHSAAASLTVTPAFSAARVRGQNRAGSLTVTPSLTAAATASLPAPAAPQGSWWGLDTVFKQSRQEFEAYASRPPMACPQCGEPLTSAPATRAGSGIERYCKFDGWAYPRDWVPPSRPMPW